MFNDCEIGIDLSCIQKKAENDELLIDSFQDDDVNTDDEVIEAGT